MSRERIMGFLRHVKKVLYPLSRRLKLRKHLLRYIKVIYHLFCGGEVNVTQRSTCNAMLQYPGKKLVRKKPLSGEF